MPQKLQSKSEETSADEKQLKSRKKDNGKNATIRGTGVRGKEEECDKKEMTNVKILQNLRKT